VRWRMAEEVPFYRVSGGKGGDQGGGSTQVVVGCFKLFGYGRRVKQ
jgi:hypothetical protein